MPSAVSQDVRAGATAPDKLDKFFEYDNAVDDFLRDLPLDKEQPNNATAHEPSKDFDEEITVKKRRKPNPKLDENLLLSQAGVPRLRKITKSRLKFRGKGHEFADVSSLLNTYQLWLDDLYPKEKFRDALSTVEKLGHSKRMQVMRRGWLDATKPQAREPSPERVEEPSMSGVTPVRGDGGEDEIVAAESDDALFGTMARPKQPEDLQGAETQSPGAPDDDELDALLAGDVAAPENHSQQPHRRAGPFEEDDDDDLDALLAEQPAAEPLGTVLGRRGSADQTNQDKPPVDSFTDDEEAMAGMSDMW